MNLFKLKNDFTGEDLKNAKKIVLQTHPDKSKLDKKYFLFFSSAYKIVFQIYNFKSRVDDKNTEYYIEEDENNQESGFKKMLKTQDQNVDVLDSRENTGDLEKKIIDKIK